MEQNTSNEPLGAKEPPRFDTQVRIHVHSLRHRLADFDGISGKAAIDGIVHAGLLRNDSPKEIKEGTNSQEQIPKTQPEETIITIETVE